MDHLSLPIDFAAVTPQAGVRLVPSGIAGKCQNTTDREISPVNNAVTAAYQISSVTGYVSLDIAAINRDLANQGAALVLALIAQAVRS